MTQSLLQLLSQCCPVSGGQPSLPAASSPDRIRKMDIVSKPWDHMPVQMRHLITQRGKIDFFRAHEFTQMLLHGEYHRHEMCTVRLRQVGHFLYMLLPDHAAIAGVIRVINQNDSAPVVPPKDGFAI